MAKAVVYKVSNGIDDSIVLGKKQLRGKVLFLLTECKARFSEDYLNSLNKEDYDIKLINKALKIMNSKTVSANNIVKKFPLDLCTEVLKVYDYKVSEYITE